MVRERWHMQQHGIGTTAASPDGVDVIPNLLMFGRQFIALGVGNAAHSTSCSNTLRFLCGSGATVNRNFHHEDHEGHEGFGKFDIRTSCSSW
jgi:hypothetical protein